jgi:hypothetical protein
MITQVIPITAIPMDMDTPMRTVMTMGTTMDMITIITMDLAWSIITMKST